ncbi:hypothetical protein F2Q69_00031709 [Brassica cretica]|uniref:Uncharacterized protein n=2 Tax=Brassica cretica TaxID=69181 RepID=A0A8S9S7D0_BRACR|nr:hypothetical protein F2Q69_00031709 [Brassica cretica]KAF3606241.1 hypothetical protein DY000_02050701 [Brassica cretica]
MPNDGHKQCSTVVLVHKRLAKFEARKQVLMLPLMMLVLMTKSEAVRRHSITSSYTEQAPSESPIMRCCMFACLITASTCPGDISEYSSLKEALANYGTDRVSG